MGQWDANGVGSIDLQEFPALWQYLMETTGGRGAEGAEGQAWDEGGGGGDVSEVYVERNRQMLGFEVSPDGNAMITSATGENARRAGLQKGDIVLSVEGVAVSTGSEALDALKRAKDDYATSEPIQMTVQADLGYHAPGGYAEAGHQEGERPAPGKFASLFSCVNSK